MGHPGRLVLVALALTLLADTAFADVKRREPNAKAVGKVYEWTSTNGTVYHYRVPEGYDPEKGAGLTFILHGSNLDRRWGFANHQAKTFRPDDIVVSPDGTTSNERGGFNSLGRPEDAERFFEFHQELRKLFKVKGTYIYGHSQGSFFAFYYAGAYPQMVQGVVGHASGVWTQTRQGSSGHHQAIVLMHGTKDPVVPYGQSVGGLTSYRDARYPMVRMRHLEGWNHWPAEHNGKVPHTSQQLAWVEGMTTEDPDRLRWCYEFLTDVGVKERHDWAAAYLLARRISKMREAPEELKSKATRTMAAIDGFVAEAVSALKLPEGLEFDGADWVLNLPRLLREFEGVAACEDLRKEHGKRLEKQQKQAIAHLRKYWPALRGNDPGKAFAEGVAAIKKGFLYYECADPDLLANLEKWAGEARKLRIGKQALKDHRQVAVPLQKLLKSAFRSYGKILSRGPDLD